MKILKPLWAVCCLAFNGCLRIHEILSKTARQFDPDFTLLVRDLKRKDLRMGSRMVRIISLRLKSPKEDRIGQNIIVDIYETGGKTCPVKALDSWEARRTFYKNTSPYFTDNTGVCLTGKKLNSILKELLEPRLGMMGKRFSGHSFRSGMASMLGKLGFTDEEIQAMGRWNSRSFEAYMKLPRSKRAEMARRIGSAL